MAIARLIKAVALMLALALVTPALAETPQTALYENVGSWEVKIDLTLDNSCFMQGVWDGHILFRAGLYADKPDVGYILMSNSEWTSLRDKQTYQVQVGFDGNPPQTRNAFGLASSSANVTWLSMPFSAAKVFFNNLAAARSIQITYNGKRLINGNLPGSALAVISMLRCTAEMTAKAAPADPFQERPRPVTPVTPRDPFRAASLTN